MSCRTTPAGSAFTSYARLMNAENGISDVATLSTFHTLRRNYSSMSEHSLWIARDTTPEAYQEAINSLRQTVMRDENLSEARKNSIIERLSEALRADPIPDPATIYALRRLVSELRGRSSSLRNFLCDYAASTGVTYDEAKRIFAELEQSIDRTRGAANPDTYTDENISAANSIGLITEAGTVHAYTMMQAERTLAVRMLLQNKPPRIIKNPVTSAENTPVGEEGLQIVEMGYDPRNGRLELSVKDNQGNITNHVYRDIQQYTYARLTRENSNPSEEWFRNIRGASYFQYRTAEDEMRGGVAPRCSICGQFANTEHACPVNLTQNLARYDLGVYQTRTSNQSAVVPFQMSDGTERNFQLRVRLPLAQEIRPTARNSSIVIDNIRESIQGYDPEINEVTYNRLSGQVAVMRDPETNQISYNSQGLECDCDVYRRNYRCSHVDNYMHAVEARITPPSSSSSPRRNMTEEQRIAAAAENQRRAEAAAAFDWTRSEETLADARKTWLRDTEVSYSENFEAFKTQYNQATAEIAAKGGPQAVPYMKENALAGMATRESGQAFGIEIEYEFPATVNRGEANRKIGEALYEAGIFSTPSQQGYHASVRNGYKDVHTDPETGKGTWSFERDGSVNGGEIVSPGMYDEPETWEKLEKVVTILRENGAVPTKRAGAHVHVGTKFYEADAKKYTELARMVNQHEDVLFRLAQNPERGRHRQGHYSEPLPASIPSGGWSTVSEVKSWQRSRTRVLNLWSTSDEADYAAHPEFRIFDSTLNAGVMQSQIKLAVAMTHAAARNAENGGTVRGKEQIGSHATRQAARGRRRMTDDELKEDTATFRSFVDTLFTREEDKKQITTLFAATKWNKADASNIRRQAAGV